MNQPPKERPQNGQAHGRNGKVCCSSVKQRGKDDEAPKKQYS